MDAQMIKCLVWVGFISLYKKCSHAVWLNPIPEDLWEHVKGHETIARICSELPMYQLWIQGIDRRIQQ